MKIKTGILSIFMLSGLCYACKTQPGIDFDKERKILLDLDAKAREDHFTKNTKSFVEGFSKDFISINRGVIDQPSYDKSFKRFDAYLKSVEFVKWDNQAEPIIRFSDDGSVAYVAVDKIVILKQKNENQEEVLDTTDFAWLSVFKRVNGKWILDCVASTNK